MGTHCNFGNALRALAQILLMSLIRSLTLRYVFRTVTRVITLYSSGILTVFCGVEELSSVLSFESMEYILLSCNEEGVC